VSDGVRIKASDARGRADTIKQALEDLCDRIVIAGSMRRGKEDVGDVEIVALPHRAPELLARLDALVAAGVITKARYGAGATRWGVKYRGLMFEGLRIEVFLADQHNEGYILWLRTGPGDANQYVMQECIRQSAPYRAEGGYWRVKGDGDNPEPEAKRISVPDEKEMFRLLGMAWVAPAERTLAMYRQMMRNVSWAQQVTFVPDEPLVSVQSTMF